jgi:hypothetical protein
MAEDEKRKKDSWDKTQVIFTIVTALTTGIWGAFIHINQQKTNDIQQEISLRQQDISNKLATLDRSIKSVDSMVPYVDKVVDKDIPKSKLAAYALYILNRDNPQMAVSMILAADKKELYDVLKDIGKRDDKILKLISEALPKEAETAAGPKAMATKSEATKSIENIMQAIQTATSGWCYLGTYESNRWSKTTIAISSNTLPQQGNTYNIIDDVYLRDKEPLPPNYTLGNIIRVTKIGEKIKVKQVVQIEGKNWIWAKVDAIQ